MKVCIFGGVLIKEATFPSQTGLAEMATLTEGSAQSLCGRRAQYFSLRTFVRRCAGCLEYALTIWSIASLNVFT